MNIFSLAFMYPVYFLSMWVNLFTFVKPKEVCTEKNVINYFIRPEIAKKLFHCEYNKLGIFIQVTKKEHDELFEIEGSKLKPNFHNDTLLTIKLKKILNNKGLNFSYA